MRLQAHITSGDTWHYARAGGWVRKNWVVVPNEKPVAIGEALKPLLDRRQDIRLPQSTVSGQAVPGLPGVPESDEVPEAVYPSRDVFPYVHFTSVESYDPDGEIVAREWEYGDSATGSGRDSLHQYGNFWLERYIVSLTVRDDCGDHDFTQFRIWVLPTRSPTGDSCEEQGGYCIPNDLTCAEGFWGTQDPCVDQRQAGWYCCHPRFGRRR